MTEQNFVALDRLSTLVLAGREVIHGLKQIDVLERFPLARLKRKHQCGVQP